MSYSGKYKLKNPHKYKGNPNNIIWRSTWELRMLKYFDNNPEILEFSSEETIVPYISPMDGKYHRYFVDFSVKVKTKENTIMKYLVEVKPLSQTIAPIKPKHITRSFVRNVEKYLINSAKWKAAKEYARSNGSEFIILTEKEIFNK